MGSEGGVNGGGGEGGGEGSVRGGGGGSVRGGGIGAGFIGGSLRGGAGGALAGGSLRGGSGYAGGSLRGSMTALEALRRARERRTHAADGGAGEVGGRVLLGGVESSLGVRLLRVLTRGSGQSPCQARAIPRSSTLLLLTCGTPRPTPASAGGHARRLAAPLAVPPTGTLARATVPRPRARRAAVAGPGRAAAAARRAAVVFRVCRRPRRRPGGAGRQPARRRGRQLSWRRGRRVARARAGVGLGVHGAPRGDGGLGARQHAGREVRVCVCMRGCVDRGRASASAGLAARCATVAPARSILSPTNETRRL